MAKQAYVYSGTDWVPLASEVTNLSNYYTKGEIDILDGPVGLKRVVPSSVAVGSGSGSVDSLGTVTFSGASTVSLNGVFTSTYKNYFLVLENITFTAGSTFGARLRLAGSDSSGANYKYGVERRIIATNVAAPFSNNGDTQFSLGDPNNSTFYADFINPQDSKVTWYRFQQFGNYAGYAGSGFFDLTTQFDGVTFFPSAGNITGTISVYGYK